jgi:ubiquitin C-terminal hydrolase
MTEQREVRIPFADLVNLVVECECGAEVTINFTKQEALEADWQNKGSFSCPVCPRKFDSTLRLGILSYLDWLGRVKDSKHRVSFRIKNSN